MPEAPASVASVAAPTSAEVTTPTDKQPNLPDVTLVGEPKEDKEEVSFFIRGFSVGW